MIDLLRKPVYRFNDVEIDVPRGCVRVAGQEVYLRQQTFQVLLYLVKGRERLVTKEELFENIWKDAAVTDNALLQCIFDIRKALGDDSRNPRYIKTFPKVGYRFIGPVEETYPDAETTREGKRRTAEQGKGETGEQGKGGKAERLGELQNQRESPFHAVAQAQSRSLAPARIFGLPVSRHHRLLVIGLITAAAMLVVPGLVGIYLIQRSRVARQPPAEFLLPQVVGKQALAVMYFDNQSGSAELDWLREGLADMLITDLSRSTNLAVLSRQQLHLLLERIGHKESENIRLNEALDIARNARANVVILGNFARLGDEIRIDVQLHDARNGQLLTAERLVVDQPTQILTQIDLLSLKLASHLGAAPSQNAESALSGVMTKSLEAYRYYSLAVEKAQALHTAEAIGLLQKAIALDPQFAMAHARIGYAYAVTAADVEKGKPYLERAFRLSDRLTEKDKLSITAWYAIANRDFPAAIASFREIISRYPLEVEAYWRLGSLLRGEERYDEAIEIAKQGLVIDAGAKALYNSLGASYLELGRDDEAIAMFQRYVELAPTEPNAHDSLGLGYQSSGHYAEAIAEYERALELNPDFEVAIIHLGNTKFQQGRYREAIGLYQHYVEISSSDFDRSRGYKTIAVAHLRAGKLHEAEQAAKTASRYNKTYSVLLLISLDRGDLTTAEKLEKMIDEGNYLERGARGSLREFYYLQGRLAQKSDRGTEALEHFKEALRHRPLIWNLDPLEDCLANAYLGLGRLDEAIAEYQRVLQINPRYPLAHYHLALAYERKNQREQARAAYEQFLQVWSDADADIPEVLTARQKLSNL